MGAASQAFGRLSMWLMHPNRLRYIALFVLVFSAYMVFLGLLNLLDGFIGDQVWTFVAFGSAICGILGARSIRQLSQKTERLRLDDRGAG